MQSPDLHYQEGFAPTPSAPAVAVPRTLRHEKVLGHRSPEIAEDSSPAQELNVSGVRVLLGLGFAIGLAGLLLWGFIRDWLFAP